MFGNAAASVATPHRDDARCRSGTKHHPQRRMAAAPKITVIRPKAATTAELFRSFTETEALPEKVVKPFTLFGGARVIKGAVKRNDMILVTKAPSLPADKVNANQYKNPCKDTTNPEHSPSRYQLRQNFGAVSDCLGQYTAASVPAYLPENLPLEMEMNVEDAKLFQQEAGFVSWRVNSGRDDTPNNNPRVTGAASGAR